MSDRYSEFRGIARDLDVDAVALVPGSNFTRLFRQSFHSHERPLVILIPVSGPPAAVVAVDHRDPPPTPAAASALTDQAEIDRGPDGDGSDRGPSTSRCSR